MKEYSGPPIGALVGGEEEDQPDEVPSHTMSQEA